MDLKKKFLLSLVVFGTISSVFLSSCKKKVDCSGLPQQMEGYFPSVSELKFSNGIGDTLILPVDEYSRSIPRTLTNNPLSVGGTGGTPFCVETIEAWSSVSIPVYWSLKLGVTEDSKTTEIRFTITEEFISTGRGASYFNKVVNETPSTLGDYKVFGDTLVMSAIQLQPPVLRRFSEAKIVYGQGLVKLHDVVNNCDWTRFW
jgi:hypothetical protein